MPSQNLSHFVLRLHLQRTETLQIVESALYIRLVVLVVTDSTGTRSDCLHLDKDIHDEHKQHERGNAQDDEADRDVGCGHVCYSHMHTHIYNVGV